MTVAEGERLDFRDEPLEYEILSFTRFRRRIKFKVTISKISREGAEYRTRRKARNMVDHLINHPVSKDPDFFS
jgi:hypothetical protein